MVAVEVMSILCYIRGRFNAYQFVTKYYSLLRWVVELLIFAEKIDFNPL